MCGFEYNTWLAVSKSGFDSKYLKKIVASRQILLINIHQFPFCFL